MKKDLLVICPTRERPDACARMIKSFHNKTSEKAELVFIIDHDDYWLNEYMDLFERTGHLYFKREYDSICAMHNVIACSCYPDYDYYSITCDDYIYHTGNWDRILIQKLEEKGGGFAYGDDMFGGPALPTTCVISGQIIRALNWIVMPELQYLCGDMVWREIGQRLNRLFYIPEVKIEHMTYLAHKAEMDATFERTNSEESYNKDNRAFREWKSKYMERDITKIREALKCQRLA